MNIGAEVDDAEFAQRPAKFGPVDGVVSVSVYHLEQLLITQIVGVSHEQA